MNSAALQQQKKLAAALKRLNRTEQILCFDPANLSSRPTKEQLRVIDAVREQEINVLAVLGGNQSFLGTSLVTMADGTLRPISQINPGDWVKTYDSKTQSYTTAKVLNLWKNGVHPVFKTTVTGNIHINVTPEHQMLWFKKNKMMKTRAASCEFFSRVDCPIPVEKQEDSEELKEAELWGFLVGDGCFTKLHKGKKFRGLQYSTARQEHVNRLSGLLRPGYYLRDCKNGDYFISNSNAPTERNYYIDRCREFGFAGHYAHEKAVPEYILKGSPALKVAFLQGLLATDGLVRPERIEFYTTSPRLRDELVQILHSLGLPPTVFTSKGKKETHRPLHNIRLGNAKSINWVHQNLTVSAKKAQPVEGRTSPNRKVAKNCRVRTREYIGHHEVFDIEVDHPDHNYICDGFLVSNSGKSNTGARILSWMFEENFPEWDRHPRWGEEPLLFLVIAQTLKQAEESLWRRIEGFLEPGSYIVNKVGGIINKVTHKKNGNVILFFSHDNPNEARKRIQSFTAHFAWVDELPGNVKLIEEVQRRVQARSGQMLMTFTPKAPTPDIKRYVEQLQEPYGQRYVLKALDNPAYTKEDKKKLMESLKSFSDKYKATILEGAWVQPEEMVYEFDYDTMVEAPPNYSPSWRHVESSDPALSSAHGLIVAAEEPNSGVWYIIRADYLREMLVPEKLIAEVVSRTGGVNLVRRIADPHEVWYIQTAATKGLQYVSPYKKNERKHELIKNLQAALGHRVKIAPWCQSLIDEIQTCHWSETAENKIAKGSRFHLLDAAQYAVDCLPKYEAGQVPQPWYAELRIANQKRKEQKAAALKRPPRPYRVIRRRRR